MTRTTVMDKQRLAAFVDGELSPEDAAAVVMHLADHPEDQAHVDDLAAANAALALAFAAPMDEPVPDHLRDLILGAPPAAKVLPFRRPARAAWGGLAAGAALAAALALVAVLPQGDAPGLVPGPLADASALHRMLSESPSGAPQTLADGTEALILASVPTPRGFCREIELIQADAGRLDVGLACTEGAGWTIEVVIAESLSDAREGDGYGTAAGTEAQGVAPFLDRIGAGAILGPQEEAAAIARTWAK